MNASERGRSYAEYPATSGDSIETKRDAPRRTVEVPRTFGTVKVGGSDGLTPEQREDWDRA